MSADGLAGVDSHCKKDKIVVRLSDLYNGNIYTCKMISFILRWPPRVHLDILRPKQNGRHFADDIFKCIFLNENVWTWIKISLKFVPQGPINNIRALVQIMAWRRPGDKPLSGPMMVKLPTHICITRPQWVDIKMSVFPVWDPPWLSQDSLIFFMAMPIKKFWYGNRALPF